MSDGRLHVAVRDVQDRGYEVVIGRCMDGSGHVSASAADRASELMSKLVDPTIRAIVPPWGGETAIDLLPLLDWNRLREAGPTCACRNLRHNHADDSAHREGDRPRQQPHGQALPSARRTAIVARHRRSARGTSSPGPRPVAIRPPASATSPPAPTCTSTRSTPRAPGPRSTGR
ncbi:LD-carboxypeptidase [Streptomyces acidicola]